MLGDLTLTDGIGLIGSLMLVYAYWGVSRRRFDPERWPYHAVNLAGSSLLLVSLYVRPNPGAILIEVLWAAIAITALLQLMRR